MFFCLCLSVCQQDNSKSCRRSLTKFLVRWDVRLATADEIVVCSGYRPWCGHKNFTIGSSTNFADNSRSCRVKLSTNSYKKKFNGRDVSLGTNYSILMPIWITLWIQELRFFTIAGYIGRIVTILHDQRCHGGGLQSLSATSCNSFQNK